ncbi:SpoIID/LytB domain-containing protein [Patulibacter defluvii]|uniref:SpoIID/LytB domain-containing protein n=1 Tax=Patulibacter defluvii TaxID=3095358 RepID=UPI002A756C71|nr:SpoIID/LytB domain-containing protein [Patulibacter sp. DM4]
MRAPGNPPARSTSVGRRLAAVALAALLAVPASAGASGSWLVVTGAGFGHGVGMSQWGAHGMAQRGADARAILAHYYSGTTLGRLPDGQRVRVALQWGRSETTIAGASRIGGLAVRPDRSYRLRRSGGGIAVLPANGPRALGRAPGGVRATGPSGVLQVAGVAADGVRDGSFRGALDVLPDGDGLLVVDDLGLEDYLRGVITGESPANWPAAALQAQAIAARTYAITTPVGGRPFSQWPDVRSQVYRGIAGETASGDAAVRATTGQVVTVDRRPVTTYFFSTSGGRTEAVENVFGGPPRSWLRSVEDPGDDGSPMHRWTRRFSPAEADRRTARFGVGSLRRIAVVRRGDSPRIRTARVVGRDGARTVDGGELQRAFDLPDRWATFTVASISGCLRPRPVRGVAAAASSRSGDDAPLAADDPAGGALELLGRGLRDVAAATDRERAAVRPDGCRLVGGLTPAPSSPARLQRRDGGRWRTVRTLALDGAGRFDATVPRGGRWRVRAGGVATAATRSR